MRTWIGIKILLLQPKNSIPNIHNNILEIERRMDREIKEKTEQR
jgi:hypothetical protein